MSKARTQLSAEQIQALEEFAATNPRWDRKSVPDELLASGHFPGVSNRRSLANLFKNHFIRKTATVACTLTPRIPPS